ncbi:MerR family transcriptional regulator [Clostridium estertheticum]|uniref:MerR family transcriptional regulator n=1 Tax=Clostridium estertheticum subsp. estertheticum TaxID=1552 RepID=A0A1J0GJ76_9CLOT|nr:MerR family transcriptional regulator [Clostridium estertheticum]APC41385.1 MerR family transcriptional regulator [Clostridium estertheticum subsp. estertheticum]MBU3072938.1 MerR family transcriptional regulator [Clostridium estertheticum]MBU3163025.1 MerR family transcriptional regulator [Clostridium estertheticum]MBU3183762.1 MerR family transcriptional regulator [Clostridium estertheticum]MBU3216539.1 MerR family transcriptional regulator [Clostridium estertheticum]
MKQYYRIGEISETYGIGKDSLMYYEKLGIIRPNRGENGYRLYNIKDVWKLNLIKELRNFDISMKRIKEYLEDRSIETTKQILQEEVKLIDDRIQQLTNNKDNIIRRLKSIDDIISDIELNKIQVRHIKLRKALKLNAGISNEGEAECIIKRLQKQYEDKIYILGNGNIGVVYDEEKLNKIGDMKYKAAFCLVDYDDVNYNMILDEGDYVNIVYKGTFDEDMKHIQNMMKYIEENKYKVVGNMIKICKINIHETAIKEEHITEIQIPVRKINNFKE